MHTSAQCAQCELLWLYASLRFHVYIYEPAHAHSGNCSGWWPPCMEVFVPVGEGKGTRSGPAQAPLECLMWQSNATCVRACALFSHLLCMPSNKLHWLLPMLVLTPDLVSGTGVVVVLVACCCCIPLQLALKPVLIFCNLQLCWWCFSIHQLVQASTCTCGVISRCNLIALCGDGI